MMDMDKENTIILLHSIVTNKVNYVYECPDCEEALMYLCQMLHELNLWRYVSSEMEQKGLIIDLTEKHKAEELQRIRETLAARPELVDFFKAFMDLNADDQARIITKLKDKDLMTAIRESVEVTEH